MLNLERATGGHRIRWYSIVGLVLVPLMIAAGFLWATWHSSDRLHRVQAAVVNLDQPVKVDGQPVPLGRQLTGGLVASEKQQNFTWVLSDIGDARSGLDSGRYAAVVTIPKNFSAAATSYSKDPVAAEQATIDVQTSQITGIADSAIGEAIASAAAGSLNRQLTEAYLDNVYLGFNQLGKQFSSVASGAKKLADGAEGLSAGIDGAAKGTDEFATGIGRLGDGAQKLSTGASGLDTGVSGLASGLGQLSKGATALPEQTRKLAGGTSGLAKGTKDLAKGARKLGAGAAQLATGLSALDAGMPALTKGAKDAATGTATYDAGVQQYAAGTKQFSGGMQQYAAAMEALAKNGLPQCPAQVSPLGDPAECAQFQAGVKAGAAAAVAGLHGDGTARNPGLVAGAKGLNAGVHELSKGAAGLSNGLSGLSTGVTKVAAGIDGLDTGAAKLSTGASKLSGGADDLSTGASQLAVGTDKLADGMPALAGGVAGSASGARQLATGTHGISTGVAGLATGIHQSAAGAGSLATGMDKLADGGAELANGTDKLATGLAKGATQIPSYNQHERAALKTVVSQPVAPGEPAGSIFSEVASTGLLLVIALWVGALASYLVVQAVTKHTMASMAPSWQLALRGLAPGAAIAVVQAMVLTAVAQLVLGLSAYKIAGVLGLTLLTGVVFAALNHALVAWAGGVGRVVSVALVVLTAAGGMLSAVPEFFDAIIPFLPLTPALDSIRALAGDGSGIVGNVGLLMVWLVGAIAASVLAISRRRQLTGAQFAKASLAQ